MFHFFQGLTTKQAHKAIPEGYFEEEQGRKGFYGAVSHLIRRKPTTRWTQIEGPLRPHLYDIVEMPKTFGTWQRMLFNSDVALYNFWQDVQKTKEPKSFKNADGDTIYFCHSGSGEVFTEYGILEYKKGTYVNMPKCVNHFFLPKEASQFLVIESKSSSLREPDRGMVGRNAVYDLNTLGRPNLDLLQARKKELGLESKLLEAKRLGETTRFYYDECIYDAVGWKGDFFPFTLHVDDIMPLSSHRSHLPPSAHTTFVANGFVICSFLPRPLESDADALKVPFYHQNIDYDEVLFYHDGNFFSRDNLHAGMMSFHPAGFSHGPHPKAVKNVTAKTHTDEIAVMVDTWQPLHIDPTFEKVEVKDYWKSWMSK
ncbi:MAG: homogentisate 1,2-dioxygenase [Pseudobdellovibrionaceae bacterium]